jgi:putative NADH-flavin reductase
MHSSMPGFSPETQGVKGSCAAGEACARQNSSAGGNPVSHCTEPCFNGEIARRESKPQETKVKIIIFGSTGGTGRELIRQALDQGHDVTAHARNPAKIEGIRRANLNVVCGDVLDSAVVESAVSGQEAVLVAIGAGAQRTTLREDGTRLIVQAMEKTGVRRLLCQSSLGVGNSRSNLPFFTKYIIISVFLRHAFADHARQESVVKQSSLDWTIVRPPYLTDGPRTGTYRYGFSTTDKRIKGKISRADVADFMLKQLTDDTYLHQAPGLSY